MWLFNAQKHLSIKMEVTMWEIYPWHILCLCWAWNENLKIDQNKAVQSRLAILVIAAA